MSTDYQAQAVIGIRIQKSALYQVVTVKSCEHDTSGMKFCPECGKKVEVLESKKPIAAWDRDRAVVGSYKVYGIPNEEAVVIALAFADSGAQWQQEYYGNVHLSSNSFNAGTLIKYIEDFLGVPRSRQELRLHAILHVS